MNSPLHQPPAISALIAGQGAERRKIHFLARSALALGAGVVGGGLLILICWFVLQLLVLGALTHFALGAAQVAEALTRRRPVPCKTGDRT